MRTRWFAGRVSGLAGVTALPAKACPAHATLLDQRPWVIPRLACAEFAKLALRGFGKTGSSESGFIGIWRGRARHRTTIGPSTRQFGLPAKGKARIRKLSKFVEPKVTHFTLGFRRSAHHSSASSKLELP
jgi:hypothetical protein